MLEKMSNSLTCVYIYWFPSYAREVQEVLLGQCLCDLTRFSTAHQRTPETPKGCDLPHTFKIFPSKACKAVGVTNYFPCSKTADIFKTSMGPHL